MTSGYQLHTPDEARWASTARPCICLDRWPSEPSGENAHPVSCVLCSRPMFHHGRLPVFNLGTHRIEYEIPPFDTVAINWVPRGFSPASLERIRLDSFEYAAKRNRLARQEEMFR